jgi:hypothetical protein
MRILSASRDGTIMLWDIESLQRIAVLEGHTDVVNICLFTPDGGHVLTGSRDKTVMLWNVDSAECLAALKGYTHAVNGLFLQSGGTQIIVGDASGNLLFSSMEMPAAATLVATDPAIVTAYKLPDGLFFRCTKCRNETGVEKRLLGAKGACAACGFEVRINEFAIDMHTLRLKPRRTAALFSWIRKRGRKWSKAKPARSEFVAEGRRERLEYFESSSVFDLMLSSGQRPPFLWWALSLVTKGLATLGFFLLLFGLWSVFDTLRRGSDVGVGWGQSASVLLAGLGCYALEAALVVVFWKRQRL